MNKINPEFIEATADEIMALFDVDQPPVPVELMIDRPREGLWERADLSELTSSFVIMSDRFSPRISVARLLARHIARSEWGVARGLHGIFADKALVNRFARAILMPRGMMEQALQTHQSEVALVNRFEVPADDFKIRLDELGL